MTRRLSPAERMAIVDRATWCDCWCGRVTLWRANGWSIIADQWGKRHGLTSCDVTLPRGRHAADVEASS